MELILTQEQKKYLNENGPIKAATLQHVYKQSVKDQQETLKEAAKIRAKENKPAK
jgi:hypothetical protein